MTSLVEWAVAIGTISAAFGIIVRAITRDVVRDIVDVRRENSDLKHSLKNQTVRMDAIENQSTAQVERIVKLESAVQSFDKAIERVERGQDKLSDMINGRFDTLAVSIREIRSVTPKG